MPKARKSRKRKNKVDKFRNRSSSRKTGSSVHSSGTTSQVEGTDPEKDEQGLPSTWDHSRSGARSSRGFHFQDAVGAWLAAQLAAGNLATNYLVPEGFGDLYCEGPEPVHYEVKSRQYRRGPFPVSESVQHIVNTWVRHKDQRDCSGQLVVILEQGIQDLEIDLEQPISQIPIGQLLEHIVGFEERLTNHLKAKGRNPGELAALTSITSVVVCSWDNLTSETERYLSNIAAWSPAILSRLAIEIRSKVADAVDKNAEAQFHDRVSLDRTGLIKAICDTAELFDLEAVNFALSSGICTPVDKQPIESGDAFYEGMSTQPGHVYAGLVIPRPDLTQQVGEGFSTNRPVLLTGPSGVGKSAILWMLLRVFPGVLWFRVHQISADTIPHIARLLRAYSASPKSPVGLLVDAAGRSEFEAWTLLQQAVMAIPGALLVGTARNEDLFSLGDLADCHVVKVLLDDRSAAEIHAGLVRRGATRVQYWQEAFEQSNGLTLEFTHLLTRGTRLQKVLTDQINHRMQQKRILELDILAVVATADCWSASVQYTELEHYLQACPSKIRIALERLVEEHLLVNQNSVLRGTHQLRSRSIVDVIHKIPPPQLADSVKGVIGLLSANALSRFIYEVLKDCPSLETQTLEVLQEIVGNSKDHLVAALRGLELLDFYRQASTWIDKLKHYKIPIAHQLFALVYPITEFDIPEWIPQEPRDAIQAIVDLPEPSATRDNLLKRIDLKKVAAVLASAESSDAVQRLLRAMRRTLIDWQPLLASLESDTSLVRFLKTCNFVDLGECISAAHSVSPDFAMACVNAIGGSDAVLERARADDPWIQELKIDAHNGDIVAVARFLYVSETVQGDARNRAIALGKKLLRTLPEINKVDVQPIRPNGSILGTKGYEYTSSELLRQNDVHPEDVTWNRSRVQLTQTLLGASETERLSKMADLLPEIVKLVRDFGNAFVLAPGWSRKRIKQQFRNLLKRQDAIGMRGSWLPPLLNSDPVARTESFHPIDSLSGLIIEICYIVLKRIVEPRQHVELSAFINETVLGERIPEVRQQPWQLIDVSQFPSDLDDLASSLSEIDAVLIEKAANPQASNMLLKAAQQGPAKEALALAAKFARQHASQRIQTHRRRIASDPKLTPFAIEVFWFDGNRLKGEHSNFAIAVPVDSLFDWPAAVEQLIPRLKFHQEPGEMPVLVPLLSGRPVRRCALRIIDQAYPVTNWDQWDRMLPDPLEERMTATVNAALSALEVCSGLSVLRDESELEEQVRHVLEEAVTDFNKSVKAASAMGEDSLISRIVVWLQEMGQKVEAEWNNENAPGTFAIDLEKTSLGVKATNASEYISVIFLALHWDADPKRAAEIFESLDE